MAKKILLSSIMVCLALSGLTPLAHAQGFNVASVYDVTDPDAKSGDIIINASEKGLTRTNVTYDSRIFGVIQDNPLLVLREASGSGRPIIRAGDTIVNVTDYNGPIKKGDYITTSPVSGKGMKSDLSGYVVGIALNDADSNGGTVNVAGKSVKAGTVNLAIKIEYAELNTARNNIQLLNELNAALFKTVRDPEKTVLIIRYIIGGMIALLAFAIGFYSVTRSLGNAIEAVGRNPLARRTILLSVGLQLLLAIGGGVVMVILVFIIIRV